MSIHNKTALYHHYAYKTVKKNVNQTAKVISNTEQRIITIRVFDNEIVFIDAPNKIVFKQEIEDYLNANFI